MKTAVFYYSQSGQALEAAKSICKPLDGQVVYKRIIPEEKYPFPWDKDDFFGVFPETRLGIPPSGIEPMDFSDIMDVDLVIIVGQPWFLSPSLPIQSFFKDKSVREYLHGRNVVYVTVCRNMWLMGIRQVKEYLQGIQAKLVGHIVLQDRYHNWVSGLTIVRWLMFGRKRSSFLLPDAGVSDADIQNSSQFGEIIRKVMNKKELADMQDLLLAAGAINYKPSVLFLEKMGHRMFGFWAKFIRMKGEFGNPKRLFRQNLFFCYLLIALFLLSPFAQLFFNLTYPLHRVGYNRLNDCGVK